MCDAFHHVLVGYLAQHVQVFVPCKFERCEALCRNARFTIHTGSRSRDTYRLVVVIGQPVCDWLPVFGHRHIGILIVFHRIAREDIPCRRLVAYRHPLLVGQTGHLAVEIVREEFVDGPAPVGKELTGLLAVFNHPSENGRHPCQQVVVSSAEKFMLHESCPRLRRTLPAVHQHIVHQSFQWSVCQSAYITAELIGDIGRVEFVHFPARSLLRCRAVLPSSVHMPDAQDCPVPLGSCPAKLSVGCHLICQVNDISSFDEAVPVLVHILRKPQQPARCPACLHLPVMSACSGGKAQTRKAHGVHVRYFEHILTPFLQVG